MRFDELEETINTISDRDWSWWPFLWLRPEKRDDLSLARVLGLAVLYGIPSSLLMMLAITLSRTPSLSEMAFTAVAFPMLFLFAGSALVAPMWNRRAERLRARHSIE